MRIVAFYFLRDMRQTSAMISIIATAMMAIPAYMYMSGNPGIIVGAGGSSGAGAEDETVNVRGGACDGSQ